MAYLGFWNIDDILTFNCNTHRFDTGAATNADSSPQYRVYEDTTSTSIITGTMGLQDSINTVGFYSAQITLSTANGFDKGKQYTVYIYATVNSVTGTTHHTLQIKDDVVDALTVDTYVEPGQGAPPATTSLSQKINYIYKYLRNKITNDGTNIKVYADDGTTVDQKASVSEVSGTVTRGEFGTGP